MPPGRNSFPRRRGHRRRLDGRGRIRRDDGQGGRILRRVAGSASALHPGMIVFLNGEFVPEEKAVISVFDRGFLFGDGLFEAMLVRRGEIFRWDQHIERLQRGVDLLKLTVPYRPEELFRFSMQLIEKNKMPECLLRMNVSRGITARGYSPKNAHHPATILSLHPV